LSSVPPGTSGAKPGHLGIPKTTFGIPGQSVPNRDCPGKTGTVGQLDLGLVLKVMVDLINIGLINFNADLIGTGTLGLPIGM